MTAYPSRENIARARELGVNEVLPKPFTTEQLGLAVQRVLPPAEEMDDSVFL